MHAGAAEDVLALEAVHLAGGGRYDSALRDIRLSLRAGELALLLVAPGEERTALLDAAAGLVTPQAGEARFLGVSWARRSPAESARARARVGRVFEESAAWVSNLSVAENVTLGLRHHTGGPPSAAEERAHRLALRFGLDGLPLTSPPHTARRDLRRAQWVRALLADPALLLLQQPALGASHADEAVWLDAVEEARAQGTAAIWVTAEHGIWNNDSIHASYRFRLVKERLVAT